MKIDRIHPAAVRGTQAKKTVLWYGKRLSREGVLAIADNQGPSTQAPAGGLASPPAGVSPLEADGILK